MLTTPRASQLFALALGTLVAACGRGAGYYAVDPDAVAPMGDAAAAPDATAGGDGATGTPDATVATDVVIAPDVVTGPDVVAGPDVAVPADVVTPTDGATCPPERLCGGRCTDLATDARNCGHCGTVCGAGLACNGGACGLDPASRWRLVAVSGTVTPLGPDGMSWDDSSAGPADPFVQLIVDGRTLATSTASNTETPVWNYQFPVDLTASALASGITINYIDEDILLDDTICTWRTPFTLDNVAMHRARLTCAYGTIDFTFSPAP